MFPKPDNNFNRRFDKMDKDFDKDFDNLKRGAFGIAVWGAFSTLLGFALLGLLVYVAHHFLMKVW